MFFVTFAVKLQLPCGVYPKVRTERPEKTHLITCYVISMEITNCDIL